MQNICHFYVTRFKMGLKLNKICHFRARIVKFGLILQWRNRRGAGASDQKIFAYVSGKKRQGKKGKGVKIEKKRRKIVKGKVENWKWKVENWKWK